MFTTLNYERHCIIKIEFHKMEFYELVVNEILGQLSIDFQVDISFANIGDELIELVNEIDIMEMDIMP